MATNRTILFPLLGVVGLLWLLARQYPAQVVDAMTAAAGAFVPRGIRNNNPGNLRFIARNPWNGQVGDDGGGYGVYESLPLGVRAAGKQLLAYGARGLNTVRAVISTWAPASENDTAAYVAAVARQLGVAPDQPISVPARLEDLAWAIFGHENGRSRLNFTRAQSDEWVNLS